MNKFSALLLSSLALSASAALAQENYATAWSGHQYVIVNAHAAGIASPVARFPLLVRLDSSHASIFTQSRAGGADIRFTKTDNTTRLPHQIESWDSAGRKAILWVLADTIPPARTNVAFRLHWGNPAAADSSSGARVFDTANAFQAVWHMAGSASENDATPNGFTATQNGTPASTNAVIGAGRSVSSGNYFRATGTASGKLDFPEGSNYTISAWVYTTVMPGHGTIVSKHDNAYALKLNADASSWEFFEFGSDITAAGWNWVNAPSFEDLGVWRLLTGVRNEFDIGLYVNGVRMDAGFSTASSTAARVLDRDVVIGAQPAGSNTTVQRAFDGVLDEVRMSNTARSDDWIRLEHETQKPGTSVVSLMDNIPAFIDGHRALQARAVVTAHAWGDGVRFRLPASFLFGAANARVAIHDARGALVSSRVVSLNGDVVAWDGMGNTGVLAASGVYVARIQIRGAEGQVLRTVESVVPLAR